MLKIIRVIIDISYYKDTYIDGNFILKQKWCYKRYIRIDKVMIKEYLY